MRTACCRQLRCVLVISCVFATLLVSASDPPDSETNPVTGDIESVDALWNSSNYDIRHTVDPGTGGAKSVTILTSNTDDDLAPRIAIKSNGDTWVVWWRDSATPAVLYRRHDEQTGAWDSVTLLSESDESSRRPRIVHDGSSTWIAYEFDSGSGTAIAVSGIQDDAEPFPTRSVLSTTTFSGDVDATLSAKGGELWISWVDSSTHVGWSEYLEMTQTWSNLSLESYASDSIDDARERIQSTILGE